MRRLGYVPALDGVRGVAIILVLAGHYLGVYGGGGGALGVDLFFVLSGFLITTLLFEEHVDRGGVSVRGFYARRARRLLPALAVLLVIYLAVSAAEGRHQLRAILEGGFYTGNAVQAFAGATAFASSGIAHLWSLAEEEQFYLLWPLALILIIRRRPGVWIATLFALLVGYRILLATHGAGHVRLYMGPDTHADGLLAGALLAVLRRSGRTMGERAAVGGFLMLVVCVLARSIMVQAHAVAWDAYGLPIFEVAGALIVGAAVSSTSLAEALRHRTLVWVGGISYSLYLWHYPILRAAQETTRGTPRADRVAGYAVAVALTFFAAWASTRFVEQPFRRRRRTQLEPSADAPAVSAQTA